GRLGGVVRRLLGPLVVWLSARGLFGAVGGGLLLAVALAGTGRVLRLSGLRSRLVLRVALAGLLASLVASWFPRLLAPGLVLLGVATGTWLSVPLGFVLLRLGWLFRARLGARLILRGRLAGRTVLVRRLRRSGLLLLTGSWTRGRIGLVLPVRL